MHPLYVCLLGRKGEMEKPGEVCEQPEAGHEDGARGRVRPDRRQYLHLRRLKEPSLVQRHPSDRNRRLGLADGEGMQ